MHNGNEPIDESLRLLEASNRSAEFGLRRIDQKYAGIMCSHAPAQNSIEHFEKVFTKSEPPHVQSKQIQVQSEQLQHLLQHSSSSVFTSLLDDRGD